MSRLLLLLGFSLSSLAFASYRVFALKVTHYDTKGKKQSEEQVLSTLDRLQYEHYHGGYRTMRVELVDHWFCPGDTHGRVYCAPPSGKARTEDRNPLVQKETRNSLLSSSYPNFKGRKGPNDPAPSVGNRP